MAKEDNENPVLTEASYGLGKVYFLAAPLEKALTERNEAFLPGSMPYWKIYRKIADELIAARRIRKTAPNLGVTEHALDKATTLAALINYSPETINDQVTLSHGAELAAVLHGPQVHDGRLCLAPNGFAVWQLSH